MTRSSAFCRFGRRCFRPPCRALVVHLGPSQALPDTCSNLSCFKSIHFTFSVRSPNVVSIESRLFVFLFLFVRRSIAKKSEHTHTYRQPTTNVGTTFFFLNLGVGGSSSKKRAKASDEHDDQSTCLHLLVSSERLLSFSFKSINSSFALIGSFQTCSTVHFCFIRPLDSPTSSCWPGIGSDSLFITMLWFGPTFAFYYLYLHLNWTTDRLAVSCNKHFFVFTFFSHYFFISLFVSFRSFVRLFNRPVGRLCVHFRN